MTSAGTVMETVLMGVLRNVWMGFMESFVKNTAVQGANMDVIMTRGDAHLAILAGMDSAVSQGVMLGVQEDV